MNRLRRGDYVRVRLVGEGEWTEAFVALASSANPASVLLMFNGMVRAPGGALIGGALPITVDYEAVTVVGLMGGEYEIEVADPFAEFQRRIVGRPQMKIHYDSGAYCEPDEEPRNTRYHMRIVRVERIPNTRAGNNLTLECGHGVQSFGDLRHANGVVLCTKCRDLDEGVPEV